MKKSLTAEWKQEARKIFQLHLGIGQSTLTTEQAEEGIKEFTFYDPSPEHATFQIKPKLDNIDLKTFTSLCEKRHFNIDPIIRINRAYQVAIAKQLKIEGSEANSSDKKGTKEDGLTLDRIERIGREYGVETSKIELARIIHEDDNDGDGCLKSKEFSKRVERSNLF